MKTNQDYKNAALAALKGHWAPAVLCTVVLMCLSLGMSLLSELASLGKVSAGLSIVVMLLMYLVIMPVSIGYYNAFKEFVVNSDYAVTGNMFRIGFAKWGRNIWGVLLMGIYIFLWTLLLVIPGLIKSYAYILTPFILVDKPELSVNESIDLSQKMMKGHKFDLFWLQLSFIGWFLLSILTLGIGFFWVIPYMYASVVAFYQDVKAEYETNLIN